MMKRLAGTWTGGEMRESREGFMTRAAHREGGRELKKR